MYPNWYANGRFVRGVVSSVCRTPTDKKSFKKTKKLVDKTRKLVYNGIKDKGKTFYKIKPSTFKITYGVPLLYWG